VLNFFESCLLVLCLVTQVIYLALRQLCDLWNLLQVYVGKDWHWYL